MPYGVSPVRGRSRFSLQGRSTIVSMSACSSSSKKDGGSNDSPQSGAPATVGSSASGPASTGTPIKVTVIGSGLTTVAGDLTAAIKVIEAGAADINAQGGINGHSIQLTICEDNAIRTKRRLAHARRYSPAR
jgi:ABC-type branched-subunit amino acid transport system substrate-binding protein